MTPVQNSPTVSPTSLRESLVHPLHREVYGYWRDIAPGGDLPGRQHVEPASLQELMPWTMLLDVIYADGEPRFRFRLVGLRAAERFGKDATGLWLDDVASGQQLQTVSDRFCTVVQTKAPLHYEDHSYAQGKGLVSIDTLALPLATDGQTVDMLMLVNVAPIS